MITKPLYPTNCILRVCALLIFAQGVIASSAFAETRQHDAHVHGEGKLNIALAGKGLHMELESPAANVVGFEHAPENAEQKEAVHKAEERLKDGETLFVLTRQAKCKLVAAKVEQDMFEGGHEEDKDEEHHDHDEHAHDEHAHNEHEGGSAHSEFHAQYQFTCEKPEKLKAIDVMIFSAFSGFEKLDVQMLTPKGQTAIQLTPKKHQVEL
jgi:hypothetical protein